jgi:hypothetical protein
MPHFRDLNFLPVGPIQVLYQWLQHVSIDRFHVARHKGIEDYLMIVWFGLKVLNVLNLCTIVAVPSGPISPKACYSRFYCSVDPAVKQPRLCVRKLGLEVKPDMSGRAFSRRKCSRRVRSPKV